MAVDAGLSPSPNDDRLGTAGFDLDMLKVEIDREGRQTFVTDIPVPNGHIPGGEDVEPLGPKERVFKDVDLCSACSEETRQNMLGTLLRSETYNPR